MFQLYSGLEQTINQNVDCEQGTGMVAAFRLLLETERLGRVGKISLVNGR